MLVKSLGERGVLEQRIENVFALGRQVAGSEFEDRLGRGRIRENLLEFLTVPSQEGLKRLVASFFILVCRQEN